MIRSRRAHSVSKSQKAEIENGNVPVRFIPMSDLRVIRNHSDEIIIVHLSDIIVSLIAANAFPQVLACSDSLEAVPRRWLAYAERQAQFLQRGLFSGHKTCLDFNNEEYGDNGGEEERY